EDVGGPVAADAVAVVGVFVREGLVDADVRVQGDTDLLEVVLARRAGRRFAHLLDGGQEQADEHGDDGDHHQQLDQRETPPTVRMDADHDRTSTRTMRMTALPPPVWRLRETAHFQTRAGDQYSEARAGRTAERSSIGRDCTY